MNSMPETTNILVVDDDPLNLQLISQSLGHAGFAITPASNGQEAMERIDAGLFDAVITDVRMPGMSGLELLRRVRQRFPGLPVIVMTGLIDDEISAAASAWNAAALFEKPVSRAVLISAIRIGMAQPASKSAPAFGSERLTLAVGDA